MRDWIDLTLHPERYHGATKKPPFFEGWYYKLVSADESQRFAVIPGIFLSDDPAVRHAFVQVFDGVSGQVSYHRYPVEAFTVASDKFEVCVGRNRFTTDTITLDIDDDLRRVHGELRFTNQVLFPVTVASPGIMGPFGWLSFMECYHGILSMDHGVQGALEVDGARVDFDSGRGYIEKDWGKSFPAGWVWMQSNHYNAPNTGLSGISLSASIAVTPLMGMWFPGFIVALWDGTTMHRFATYTGARVERLAITDGAVDWSMRGSGKRLEIHATRADASLLPGPDRADMGKRVPETLKAEIEFRLTRADGTLILAGSGRCAGLEVAGETERLMNAVNPKRSGSTQRSHRK
ncbi:MAG: tocopherol cyclase family protein [Chloroflexota bacterium]|nr:tocopherol cyclase family protein [Chloroflexota bacterium]